MSNKALRELVEAECKKHIKDVPGKIRLALEDATLSLIGIEKSAHRGHEIDHCNGRNSVLIDAFRSLAIEEAKRIAKNYSPSADDVIHYAEAFKKEFRNQLHRALMEEAKTKAKEEAEKLMKAINLDIESFISSPPIKE